MRPLTVADAENVILVLQDKMRRSDESRYDHRLPGLPFVAQGMTATDVFRGLGDSPRTVQYWVRRFHEEGLAGLAEGDRPGRPRRFTEAQMRFVESALRRSPYDVGLSVGIWNGETLSAYLQHQFEIDLGVRQCQRLFRQLGFQLRQPRPVPIEVPPKVKAAHRKTPGAERGYLVGPRADG